MKIGRCLKRIIEELLFDERLKLSKQHRNRTLLITFNINVHGPLLTSNETIIIRI